MNSDDKRLVEKIRTESNEIAEMLNLPVPSQVKQLIEIVDWQDEALREARELMQKGLNIHKTRLGYTKQWVLAIIAWLDKYGDEE